MNTRNQDGQTVLYEAIEQDYPEKMIKLLFKYGVNVASRDRFGRTARDFAEILENRDHMKYIDNHVLEVVKECLVERLEKIVLNGYDHVLDIVDKKGKTALKIAKKHSSAQLCEVLVNYETSQVYFNDKMLLIFNDKCCVSIHTLKTSNIS